MFERLSLNARSGSADLRGRGFANLLVTAAEAEESDSHESRRTLLQEAQQLLASLTPEMLSTRDSHKLIARLEAEAAKLPRPDPK